MISYGSHHKYTSMPQNRRSHQLGKGQAIGAEMPLEIRSSQLVYGSQMLIAETLCGKRSHQLGEGHQCGAEMPTWTYPPRLVLESQGSNAEMPMRDRSQGKGQTMTAEMPEMDHPSQSVYGSRNHNAVMSMEKRSHLFTRGQSRYAAMPRSDRLSREGSDDLRSNVTILSPFPTSYRGSVLDRRNAKNDAPPTSYRGPHFLRRSAIVHSPPPVLGHLKYAAMLIVKRPILTRGHTNGAAMPLTIRLATKEIQYGYKI